MAEDGSGASVTLTFTYKKSTKNTHAYAEEAGEGKAIVGSLYVQKEWAGGEPPPSLIVSLMKGGATGKAAAS